MGGPTNKEIKVKQTINFEIASLYGTKKMVLGLVGHGTIAPCPFQNATKVVLTR